MNKIICTCVVAATVGAAVYFIPSGAKAQTDNGQPPSAADRLRRSEELQKAAEERGKRADALLDDIEARSKRAEAVLKEEEDRAKRSEALLAREEANAARFEKLLDSLAKQQK